MSTIETCCADVLGRLTINSVDMHRLAFCVTNTIPLWFPPANRGDNVVITGAPGQRGYPLEVEQTDVVLPMLISGQFDVDDDPDSDGIYACLNRNIRYLRDNVYGPTNGDATYAATLDLPWGDTYAGDVQVLEIAEVLQVMETVKSTITIRIPAGEFALVP